MKKADTLKAWEALPANLPILPHFQPIPYKASGSTYGACGIRIDGSPEFIDAVLSRMKDLIDGENAVTRLTLARNEADGSGIGKALPNAVKGAQCCYIRLHVRGSEAQHVNAFYDKSLSAASVRFAQAIGA